MRTIKLYTIVDKVLRSFVRLSDTTYSNKKTVARVGRWQGRIVMAWLMIRKHMIRIMSVYGPHTKRMESENEEFNDALERMLGLVEL